MSHHKYWGYGLNILSEIEFPELLPCEFAGPPDVQIKFGLTPETIISDGVVNKVRVSMSPTEYLLRIKNTANYYAADGDLIIAEPLPGADEKSVRLFLLSNGMSAILYQRNMIPMHASAIEHRDGIVLFCGSSGSGKSTTASMLQKMGYNVFSDDVCVLKYPEMAGKPIEALPSYPIIKLWRDSFKKVGIEMASENDKLRPKLPKYARFYHDSFNIAPRPVKQVFILDKYKLVNEPGIEKLGPVKAFSELQQHSYRQAQMNAMKKRDVHFAAIAELAKTSGIYKITRPSNENTLERVIDLIVTVLNQNE